MSAPCGPTFTRRALVKAGAGFATAALVPAPLGRAAAPVRGFALTAGVARAPLAGPGYPEAAVWAYDGSIPGPEIRARQGDRVRVVVANRLPQPTTVHWHGLRVPNAMDGVPGLTQPEIPPGGEFVYEFDVPDAGTFWYHPHVNSAEQVGRGLAGAFVVEERNPPRVDRDLTWVLTDWRLTKEGAIAEDFGHPMDLSHAGRLGNTATLNGQNVETFAVRSGERLRLRLVNTASARVFGLVFEGHRPRVIALDGQPVEPHEPEGDRVVVPPGQRVDLILDMTGRPGDRAPVVDTYYANTRYKFIDLAYDERPPLRPEPLPEPAPLAPNPLPEPDVANTLRREIVLHGGAMQQGAHTYVLGGQAMDLRALFRHGKVWAINGVVDDHNHQAPPLATVERGRTVVLAIRNESMWEHPMHLHGFAFRILSYDGQPAPRRPWADTVFLKRLGSAEIAFVADSPGDWLFHCHVLEHHMAGMSAVLRVT